MEITQVKVFPVREDKLKAFVSVVFDHCFMVNDIKVIQGKDGLFLSMPSRRKRNGEFKDVAHPLNNETRRSIEESVLSEYRSAVGDETPRRPDREADGDDDESLAADVAEEDGSGDGPEAASGRNGRPPVPPVESSEQDPPAGGSPEPEPAPRASSSGAGAGDNGSPGGSEESGRTSEADADDETDDSRPTLEEVQKEHLSDSFWSVT